MPVVTSLTPPNLVEKWKTLVNENVVRNRDIHLITQFLLGASPVQVLLGMYRMQENRYISIPQFLKSQDDWMELDDEVAKIELALHLANVVPVQYYLWKELSVEENARDYRQAKEALQFLKNWANRIVL